MSGFYEGDGHEIRSCDLALHFYRKGKTAMNGHGDTDTAGMEAAARGLNFALERIFAAFGRRDRRDPNVCMWCGEPLDDLEITAVRDPVVEQLGRLCRRCAAKQERVR